MDTTTSWFLLHVQLAGLFFGGYAVDLHRYHRGATFLRIEAELADGAFLHGQVGLAAYAVVNGDGRADDFSESATLFCMLGNFRHGR